MIEITFKLQAVVFGKFDFPVDTQTSIMLLDRFKEFGLFPSVVQSVDVNRPGVSTNRLSLGTIDQKTRIIFSDDRIDFLAIAEKRDALAGTSAVFKKMINTLDTVTGSKKFQRIAWVDERVYHVADTGLLDKIASHYMPKAVANPIEWTYRWAGQNSGQKFTFTLHHEIARMAGSKIENFVQTNEFIPMLKVMFDIAIPFHSVEEKYTINDAIEFVDFAQTEIDRLDRDLFLG